MVSDRGQAVLFCLALAFLVGCTTTTERIEGAVDRLGWLEKESPAWQEAVGFLVDKDRTAARIIHTCIADAYYEGEHYREYKEEVYAIRAGIARALGRMKYAASATALDDFLPVSKGPETMREECAWALGEMGNKDPAVVAALTQALEDTLEESEHVRLAVLVALCKLDDEMAGARLVTYLASNDASLVRKAAEGLKEAHYHAVPCLVAALKADTLQITSRIEPILEALCDRLVKDLDSDKREIRLRAARALGDIGKESAVESLLSVLQRDEEGRVRSAAATSLSKMGNQAGMDYLFKALGSRDDIVRTRAVEALIESGEAVQDRLVEALAHSDNLLVRAGSARVLGENRVSTAAQALLAALHDKAAAVRWNAVVALGRIGDRDARPPIEELLEREPDPDVIHWARWALTKLGNKGG